MNVSIRIRDEELRASLIGLQADIPWTIQQTINDLLKMAQLAQYETMRKNFTIRNESFLKYSVRLAFATRSSQRGSISMAGLGSQAESVFSTFETGGTKTPRGNNIAVPSTNAWPNRGSKRPGRNAPRNLQNSFVMKKGGNKFIMVRKGKGRKKPPVLMYSLEQSVRIPNRLHFMDTVIPLVNREFAPTLERLLRVSAQKRGFKI